MLPHADLPERAAQVDNQEFQHVENPCRGVLHANDQPPLVVQLDASGGVESHGRVEDVVIAAVGPVEACRAALCAGLVAAQGVGPGDQQRIGMPRAE